VFFVVVVLYLASYNLYFLLDGPGVRSVLNTRSTTDGKVGPVSSLDDGRTDDDGRTEDDDEGGRGKNGDDASSGEFSTRNGGNARAGEEGAR
jgi:hypothetical protein